MFSAKKKRRSPKCLNCGYPHGLEADYCPNCGQKNEDVNVPITILLGEFLATYLALDSKLFKSLGPFIFKPGLLTLRFNEGKRMSYSNPLRLYVVTSIIYFFVLSFYLGGTLEKVATQLMQSNFSFLPTTENFNIKVIKMLRQGNNEITEEELMEMIPDKIRNNYPGMGVDSILMLIESKGLYTTQDEEGNTQDSATAELRKRPLKDIVKDESVSDDLWLSFLKMENASNESTKLVGLKLRKLLANEAYFVSYAFKNLPLMMLLAIPIFALLLKLLYIRRGIYYIEHVIHALHIHSFAYLLFSVSTFWFYSLDNNAVLVLFLGFLIVTLYAYWSFRRVYKQVRWKTVVKFLIIGNVYFQLLMLLLIGELYVSVILF